MVAAELTGGAARNATPMSRATIGIQNEYFFRIFLSPSVDGLASLEASLNFATLDATRVAMSTAQLGAHDVPPTQSSEETGLYGIGEYRLIPICKHLQLQVEFRPAIG